MRIGLSLNNGDMSLDEFLRPKETETTRAVKERRSSIVATREKQGDEDALFTVQEAIMEYASTMKEKYPELCKQVEAYHALIGSGLPVGSETVADFPNEEDSVRAFLDSLQKKLLRSETI